MPRPLPSPPLAVAPASSSPLRTGVGARLAVAGVAVLALWTLTGWAMGWWP